MTAVRASRPSRTKQPRRFPVAEALLVILTISLVFQLFPELWWRCLAIVNIRRWTWRSWAVASFLWIVVMVGLKAWRDAADSR